MGETKKVCTGNIYKYIATPRCKCLKWQYVQLCLSMFMFNGITPMNADAAKILIYINYFCT